MLLSQVDYSAHYAVLNLQVSSRAEFHVNDLVLRLQHLQEWFDITGFQDAASDGYCRTGPEDRGLHTICCQVTQPFLDYLALQGNDLITPRPEYDFPGLTPGDRWCVCVRSWAQAFEAGQACPVVLEASHISVLEFVELDSLKTHAVKV